MADAAPSGQMRATSPSDSFYAVSDSEDDAGEYGTIRSTSSGRGVKLLFSKSKVYIHPTPSAKDNIAGYIALLQQKPPVDTQTTTSNVASEVRAATSLLLAWIPETSLGDHQDIYVKVDLSENDGPPRQSYLVPPPPTVTSHTTSLGPYSFAVPVSAIYSLTVRPPSIGWWYGSVIINSQAGDSFPPLFFHDSECQSTIMQKKKRAKESFDPFGKNGEMFWGGDEVLRWLRRYINIERCGPEPNIYLVNPSAEDKQAFGGHGVSGTQAHSASPTTNVSGAAGSSLGSSPSSMPRDAGMDPLTKLVKETGWNLMEKFSKVTTFTRRTADSLADSPKIPPQVRRLLRNPEVQTLQEEFDSARIYLARWAMGIAEQSEKDRKQRIWTAQDVLEMEETDVGDFELLDSQMSAMGLMKNREVVTLQEWNTFFNNDTGRLSVTVDEVKERIFRGGLDSEDGVRKEAWLFLLGVYNWHSTASERKAEMSRLRDEYIRLKSGWWDKLIDSGGNGEEGEWWREQKARIAINTEKDVHRTDRNIPIFAGEDTAHPDPKSPFADVGTNAHLEQLKDMLLTYNEYNQDLGYVQGMSDLLAPIYAVMQDDAIAFWGFQHFMDRMERNFLRDQSGMRAQLTTLDHLVQLMDPKLYIHLQNAESTNFFFFFRMLLVWYKREFEWDDILRLWEMLWTDYLSSNFHLFIALATLEKHRDVIMTHLKHFDEVLKYINELSGTLELQPLLVRAEALFRRFQRTVEAVDRKASFPAPMIRRRLPVTSSKSTEDISANPARPDATQQPKDDAVAASSSTDTSQAAMIAGTTKTSGRGDTGKRRASSGSNGEEELAQTKPQVISIELRELLKRKPEILPRKVVQKKGDGLDKARR